jgi:uncharacterized protein (DUF427 family)
MKAVWNNTIIAQSDETIVVEGNHYFPPHAVNKNLLTESRTHTHCPWKGEASYYTIQAEGQENKDAAWYYPNPKEAAKQIAGYIAFWKGVKVEL